ncbi:MAG: molybdopterin-dependent oxidoreductase [Chloroflexi bacterium]|nr:molybdopterin-dependent oxidoreductase [Chloroflexota bacterium]
MTTTEEANEPVQPTARPTRRAGFIAGALGGLLMTLVLVALRFTLDAQILTEVMADWFTRLLPASVFDFFIEQMGFNAKRMLFVLIFLGQIGVGGLIGMAYVRYETEAGYADGFVKRAAILTGGIWAVLALVVSPLLGAGVLGSGLPDGAMAYAGGLLFAVASFSLTLTQIAALAERSGGVGYNASRRDFVQKAAIFSVIVVVGGVAIQTILTNLSRLAPSISGRRALGVLSTPVTPNDEFYVIGKSAVLPEFKVETWALIIQGDGVRNPINITYDQLLAMPAIEEYVTLTCISNPVGGDFISNALWKGVPLKHILELADFDPATERVGFWAADGYFDSFPYEIAMRDEVIVAYQMNGERLPAEHGFPARIIVPGLYGMENVKWLVKMEPVEDSFRGFWQRRGWQDTAIIKTMSRIDTPANRGKVPVDQIEVAGVAFAGKRGIKRVEVSVDDGETWRDAKFDAPLSPFTWVIWRLDWPDAMPSEPHIVVRATDGTGATQTEKKQGNQPSGPTGYHRVRVFIEEPSPTPTPVGTAG